MDPPGRESVDVCGTQNESNKRPSLVSCGIGKLENNNTVKEQDIHH